MAYEFKTSPFKHQKEALKSSVGKEYFAFLMEMGTGKTKVSIDEIGISYDQDIIDAAVIFAPKGVYTNWVEEELPTHMPDDLCPLIVKWDGKMNRNAQRMYDRLISYSGLSILVINTESVSRGKSSNAYKLVERFLRERKSAMYVDESTYIKNRQATRTKAIISLGTLAVYRRILTGSPVPSSPMDFFSQFAFLKKGSLGTSNFFAFQSRYAVMKDIYTRDRVVKAVDYFVNLDDLQERVGKMSYRKLKSECLDLPDKIYMPPVKVDLTKEQKELYDKLRKDAFAVIGDSSVSYTEVITLILRLHQIVCGHIVDDDGNHHDIPTNRLDVMSEQIAQTHDESKFIIWARYRRDIQKIVDRLSEEYGPESVVHYYGSTTSSEREEAKKRFQNDKKCRFFVGNQQTGGYGITLTAAEYVLYYSNDFDLEKRLQSEDRAHRSGQNKNVVYIDLVAEGTVDEKILTALKNKKNIADLVTGDKAQEFLSNI